MEINIDGNLYEVIVNRKIGNKNSYLRVKDDGKIYLSTNLLTPNFMLKTFVLKNKNFIKKAFKALDKKEEGAYYFLGEKTKEKISDIVLKRKARPIFEERLELVYNNFSKTISYPELHLRKMSSRWGVCNIKLKKITLNTELVRKDLAFIDYVIVHELAHFIYPNHGKEFWKLVEKNYPNYKEIRRKLTKNDYTLRKEGL